MRILLADDQAKVRSALRLLLEQEPGMDVVGEVAEAEALAIEVKDTQPDLVLLDWELPGLVVNGRFIALWPCHPYLKVIALSGRPEARRTAIAAGVDAFVCKGDPPERLLRTLRLIGREIKTGMKRDVSG
jgi:DNA-binding NarL/FixJ family response regulator